MSIFNAKDFGAAGNGVQDDFPAFRQALDTIEQLYAGSLNRGAILFIPSGKYRLTQTLVVTRSIILLRCGASVIHLGIRQGSKSPGKLALCRDRRPERKASRWLGDVTRLDDHSATRGPDSQQVLPS